MKENEKKENKWQALEEFKSKGNSIENVASSNLQVAGNQKPETGNKKKPTFKEKKEFEDLEKENFVAIDYREKNIDDFLANHPNLLYLKGDATNDDILKKAKIEGGHRFTKK